MPDGNSPESAGESLHEPAPIAQAPTGKQLERRQLWMWIGGGVLVLLALYEAIPWAITAFRTESTDDAYVNGHVTFVAPRVPGQVVRVLVDDNNRVRKGALLVQLDKEPYQVKVDIAQAALLLAQTGIVTAQTKVRGLESLALSQRFDLANATHNLNNQVADLHSKVDALQAANATLIKARADYGREQQLYQQQVISKSDFDSFQKAFSVAQAQQQQAEHDVGAVRAELGLPPTPKNGNELSFCAYAVLYANTISLPALLQSLFGYDATTSGLVLSPSGIFAIIMLVVVGAALSRGVDARYLMGGGLITMAIGNYWMAHLNLEISPWQVVWPRVVVIAGLSMLFAPLNVAAFIYLPKEIRGAAVGLLALLRNEGGSVGTSVAQIIQERREQFHTLRLNESLDPLNPPVNNLLTRGQAFFLQHNGDAVLSHQMALGVLGQSRAQQASSLAYFDVFSFSAAVGLMLVFYPADASFGSGEGGAHWWRVASSGSSQPVK